MTHTPNTETPPFSVALASGAVVKIDREDRDAVIAQGYTNAWFLVGGVSQSVRTKFPGTRKPVSIARLIVNAAEDQRVKFVDGDPLNLRRANLTLSAFCRTPETPKAPKAPGTPRARPAAAKAPATASAAAPLTLPTGSAAVPARAEVAGTPALDVAPWEASQDDGPSALAPVVDATRTPAPAGAPAPARAATPAETPAAPPDAQGPRTSKERAAILRKARLYHLALPPEVEATLTKAEAAALGRGPAEAAQPTGPGAAGPSLLTFVQRRHPRDLAAQVRLLLELAKTVPAPVSLPEGLAEAVPRPVQKSLRFLRPDAGRMFDNDAEELGEFYEAL